MPVAGHGKVLPDFHFLSQCKTANLIDNEIHVTAETILIGQTWKHMQDATILTGIKIHALFLRVLARISIQKDTEVLLCQESLFW